MNSNSARALHLMLFAGLVAIDQWTKHRAVVSPVVSIAHNQGISFGILSNMPQQLHIAVSVVVLVSVILILKKPNAPVVSEHPYLATVFLAGALSNLLDRIMYGAVRDWLPILGTSIYNNLADWYIFTAVVCIIVFELRSQLKT